MDYDSPVLAWQAGGVSLCPAYFSSLYSHPTPIGLTSWPGDGPHVPSVRPLKWLFARFGLGPEYAQAFKARLAELG